MSLAPLSPSQIRPHHFHPASMADYTAQDTTTTLDCADASMTSTTIAATTTFSRPSRTFPAGNHSLAGPPSFSHRGEQSHFRQRENFSPTKQAAGCRDRFIARNNLAVTVPGGLAETCGFKTSRVLEYNHAPPVKRKFAAAEFVSLYAEHQPQRSTLKPSRKFSTKPTKMLDAPGIVNDFYANIIDWSQGLDQMAVGLGSTVYCWDPATLDVSVVAELDPNGDGLKTVTSVKWSREDACLAVATNTGEVQIWDTASSVLMRTLKGRNCERVAALSWNEPILSSGGKDGSIWNHDVRIKRHKVAELRAHTEEVCGLEWRSDGRMLASGGNDNAVMLWDARVTGAPMHQLTSHLAAVKALSWCPWQSNLLASGGGSADKQVHFSNAVTGNCTKSIDAGSQVTSLHWNENYKEIAATLGYPNNSVAVWSFPSLAKQTEIVGAHDARILGASLSKDGQTLVTCSADENIKFWDLFKTNVSAKKQDYETLGSMHTLRRV